MAFKSNRNPMFRSQMSETIFEAKYAHGPDCETWADLAVTLVEDVCGDYMTTEEKAELAYYIAELMFIPGGRYLYYAGRDNKFFNNCYLMRSEEDTREDWANLAWKVESALMTGGGIGNDYSIYRPKGTIIARTGGEASGPLPKMMSINEQGRQVMQGGSRRSAMYASLDKNHADIWDFLVAKNWHEMPVGDTGKTLWDIKQEDFNFPAPLDMTNISVNYSDDWLVYSDPLYMDFDHAREAGAIHGDHTDPVFLKNVRQALTTAEPGFSFNFFEQALETLRNACTEVTSEDDSDVCNLGSINMGRVDDLEVFKRIIELSTKFLVCGTLKAELPYEKVHEVRAKNRRLGLGLMGVHEWMLARGLPYGMGPTLRHWMFHYEAISDRVGDGFCDELGISRPVAKRAIAPTGSIAMLAGTTGGIEPLYAVAYKRRYLKNNEWHYQYVVDEVALEMIEQHGIDPEDIETALDLAEDPERRIAFQADMQDFVDQGISSTLNLPAWGTPNNNEDTIEPMAKIIAKYAPRLRGLTFYPDGARGGQPLTSVPYQTAREHLGEEFLEAVQFHDACEIGGKGGTCGI